jgi:hypothetical protein
LKATLGPKNFSTILEVQPLPSWIADIGVQSGGNMLGLERTPRNKLYIVVGVALLTPAAEKMQSQIYQKSVATSHRIRDFAKSVGSAEDFIYLPYADAPQDPLRSYGAANVQHIREVAKKYDPQGFFQRRVPGGFKISRVG